MHAYLTCCCCDGDSWGGAHLFVSCDCKNICERHKSEIRRCGDERQASECAIMNAASRRLLSARVRAGIFRHQKQEK